MALYMTAVCLQSPSTGHGLRLQLQGLARFGVVGSLEKALIMTCDYGMHIRKTTVTNFYRVTVKNFVIFAAGWKMLIN